MKAKVTRPPLTVRIDGLSHDGRGVARLDGKTVFVAGALPGEEVSIRILRSRNKHDEASMISVLSASPERVVPACRHAGLCGGCNLQHLRPDAQLSSQQQRLADALARIGKVVPRQWLAPVSSEAWGYRSRARLAVSRDPRSGEISAGFRQEESARIEGIDECPVLSPSLASLPSELRLVLGSLRGTEIPREIWIAAGDDGIGIGFCARQPLSPDDRARLESFGRTMGARIGFGVLESEHLRRWETPAPRLEYSPEPGIRLAFAPWDFTQSNHEVNRILVARVIELLSPSADEGVLDFFCGVGNFSIPLARRAGRLIGYESNPAQVATATANARENGAERCEFHALDLFVAESMRLLPKKAYSLAVLDPPRAGAALLCQHLHAFGLRRLAYVSCDAATLARDARILCDHGFKLEAAGVLQMFPHTAHAESLAFFVR